MATVKEYIIAKGGDVTSVHATYHKSGDREFPVLEFNTKTPWVVNGVEQTTPDGRPRTVRVNLAAGPSLKVKTVEEFLARVKSDPTLVVTETGPDNKQLTHPTVCVAGGVFDNMQWGY